MITFDPDGLKTRIAELEGEMGRPGFWDDQQHAASVSTEHSRLARRLERYDRLRGEYDDAKELAAMDGDMDADIAESIRPLRRELGRLEEEALFNGEYDAGDAIVTIVGGTGGTDAQDWAEILVRMYLRWAEARGFQAELLEASPGEEAGLKSATFTVKGENAYGALKAERGVHRLVRLSPFDQAHRRHTSFAQVIVSPLVPDDVVQCQNERSQSSNKATAMRVLKSRLAEVEQERREEELAKESGVVQDTGFGSQIRSYVLHPYQIVKDHRTDHEAGNAQGVLDGDLDGFIHAYLLARATGKAV